MFSPEELARYSRHIILPEFNLEGQKKLKQSKVLVVGAGGLGSPLLMYLAAAGVGTIGIVEFDTVDESNLQRQVLFSQNDIGKLKGEIAKEKIIAQNPHIKVNLHKVKLDSSNALEIIREYDVIADGTDNFATRYLVNDSCVLEGKTNVYASIFRFDGQVSVFNQLLKGGTRGPNYRDIFSQPPPPGLVPSCAEGGVLGVLPGIIGSLQALEVIKVIAEIGETLSGRLFVFDALSFSSRIFNIHKDPSNPISGEHPTQTGLIDYDEFCGVNAASEGEKILNVITVEELKEWKEKKKDFSLIDVREAYEYDIANLGGKLIPLNEIESRVSEIPREGIVVLHCRSGKRSANAIALLEEKFGYTNLFNLKGGILEWSEKIDPSVPKY